MKVLNLYAGIGGNRKLWTDVEVTAIEIDPIIAGIYQDLFPKDTVIVTDAHKYLLENFKEYDFIWSSPPCPTHSQMRKNLGVHNNLCKPVYPDMKLYEEIIFLQTYYEGLWCVENVQSYYDPLIRPQSIGHHYFWANFLIAEKNIPPSYSRLEKGGYRELQKKIGIDLTPYKFRDKRLLIRNAVIPELGAHIMNCALGDTQLPLTAFSKRERTQT